ncbi:MAG: hypothetical protein QXR06_04480 [Candidatus Bathyarchaeia archaeon]|nr:hypothetical protein [Candidatus Bathyarchaeota archaeon]
MNPKEPIVRWEDVEFGLGSIGRLRILRKMIEKPDEYFSKYALERATGLKPVDVRRDLEVLLGLDWVKEYGYDPKRYKVNLENEAVKVIAEFMRRFK